MKLLKTKISGVKLVKTNIYKDKRGFLKEIYRKELSKKNNFIFDIMSTSKKNVLRGLHIQLNNMQAKLITVAEGKIFDVAVDLRPKSKTFGKYVGITISHDDDFSFLIPSGFAHGFVCMSKKCTVYYKANNYRDSKTERTLAWNDKSINIKWPIKNPILSNKDKNGIDLMSLKNELQ
tara:strand:+ start:133 stop:663 length:531 start_codon:yes stop_codon:yes gene_type:complete